MLDDISLIVGTINGALTSVLALRALTRRRRPR